MMKYYNIILLMLLMSSLVVAQNNPTLAHDNLGTFRQGTNVTLIQGCADSTYSNISRVLYPNSTVALQGDITMNANGDFYTYEFTSTQALGEYVVYGHCDEFQIDTQFIYSFDITYNGKNNTTGTSIVSIGVLFFIFFMSIALLISGFFLIDKPIIRMLGYFFILVGLVLIYVGSSLANTYLISIDSALGGGATVGGLFVFFARIIKYSPYLFTLVTMWVVIQSITAFKKQKNGFDGWDENSY